MRTIPTRRNKKHSCNHEPDQWELCSDGVICLACNEGVCPECRKKWKEKVVANGRLDIITVPACKCDKDKD